MKKEIKVWRIALFLTAFIFSLSSCTELESQTGLKSVDWLPESASDVNYSKTRGWFVFDCKMSEVVFLSWAESKEYHPKEVKSPTGILLYSWIQQKDKTGKSHEIVNGLEYHEISGGGGGVTVVYDRDIQRLFCYYQVN